jgi:hypothetical protein
MGKTYQWGINPFQDFLFQSILYGGDIASKELETDVFIGIATILEYMTNERKDIEFLDFEITKKNDYFRVVAKNAITALWLSGIFPRDPKKVMETNEFIIDDIRYKYSLKTKKLTYQQIKK